MSYAISFQKKSTYGVFGNSVGFHVKGDLILEKLPGVAFVEGESYSGRFKCESKHAICC